MRINVVMTVYNRALSTEQCLRSLERESAACGVDMCYFVTNDGCSDETPVVLEKFRAAHPDDVYVLEGDGSLFWGGGMSFALEEALKHECDFVLLVNDDVKFLDGFLKRLLDDAARCDGKKLVTGAMRWSDQEKVSYSGSVHTLTVSGGAHLVPPSPELPEVEVANANCLLVPAACAQRLGLLDEAFKHARGDYDYTLRARKEGFPTVVSSDYVGVCDRNSSKGTWQDKSLPRKERFRLKNSIKGEPLSSELVYYRRWCPRTWPFIVARPYIKILLGK